MRLVQLLDIRDATRSERGLGPASTRQDEVGLSGMHRRASKMQGRLGFHVAL